MSYKDWPGAAKTHPTNSFRRSDARQRLRRPSAWGAVAVGVAVLVGAPNGAYGQGAKDTASALAEAERLSSDGFRLYDEGKYDAAVPLAERALAIVEKALGPDHPDVATSLQNLALLYDRKGDYELAEPLLRRALVIREKALGPEEPEVASSLNDLAALYYAKGDYAQAEPLIRRALAIQQKAPEPDHTDVATSLNNLAALYYAKGDYIQAEPLYRRSLTIREKALGLDHPAVALSLNNLAALHKTKGDYAQAEPLYRRALAINERVLEPDHPQTALSLNNLADLYDAMGDYAQAEPLSRRALAIREKALGPDHPDVAQSLNNLAWLYNTKGNYAQAEPLYRRALAIREKVLGPEHPQVALSLNNLAALHDMKGDYPRAEALYRRALAIREKALGPEHPQVALSLNNLAALYDTKKDYAQAEALYRRALAIREKALGPEHPDVADSLNNLASLYLAQGETAEATSTTAQAAAIEERNIAVLLTTGSDEQKRAYMAKLLGTTHGVVSLHLQFAPNAQAAHRLALTTILRRKGRVLDAMTDSFAALRRRVTPASQAKLDLLRSASSEYSALVWRGPATMPLDVYTASLARLDSERQELESDISRSSAELSMDLRPTTLEQVQAALPKGSALVEWYRYEPFNPRAAKPTEHWGEARYAAYVLQRGGEIAWADLGEAAPIEAAVEALRGKLRRAAADPKPAARALDALVMQPVRRLLGETRWVFLSPDSALNLVPFAALRDEDGHYLVERYAFSYLTSGRDLMRLGASSPSHERPIVLAAPDFGAEIEARPDPAPAGAEAEAEAEAEEVRRSADMSNRVWTSLPFAAEEGRALSQQLPEAILLFGAKATESAVKALRGPRMLHIATHGFFLPDQPELRQPSFNEMSFSSTELRRGARRVLHAENPLLRSGLVFAGANRGQSGKEDGVLTALEASQLDLTGTKLVVLSACETAVGEAKNGEGVYGLRRALVIAGAEAQVMSLWQVSDEATREQMQAYYDRLLRGGGRSESMRRVQLAMLQDPQRSHPYYWAPFIVSGNPAALDGRAAPPEFVRVTPGGRGCACEVGAGERRDTAAWLLSVAALGWAHLRRRRPRYAVRSARTSEI